MSNRTSSKWIASTNPTGLLHRLIWWIDKRFFRWDQLPNLARLPFIRKSYWLLVVIPVIDQILSPLLKADQIVFDLGWVSLSPISFHLSLETGIPYSWTVLYFLTVALASGSIIYEIFHPRILGRDDVVPTQRLIFHNFREVAVGLLSGSRQNHFLHSFLSMHSTNYNELAALESHDPAVTSLQEHGSEIRLSRKSIYYLANELELNDDTFDEALIDLVWFANETGAIARWLCGTAFIVAIALAVYLFAQGFMRMV